MTTERKYTFSWSTIGDQLAIARPSLGATTRVEVYRLLQYTLRDILEEDYGHQKTDEIFRRAGAVAGREFFNKFCTDVEDIPGLVMVIENKFRDLGMGLFRVESINLEDLCFTLNVEEDLDCSGLPDTNEQICVYDEGFIQGILESFTGKKFEVREIDCWCTGARTCRFSANAVG
ncbi:V4R domain-containing protein [Desulfovibrio intestinalis]|uniref:4-vinyl reductase 4VR domain-containing protein n=1 Tax=Desulfovibrio intestinalis TaxID=58621 RepID=A0A7W8FGN1_9BACT|nr:4-vinyl reductase [Desulfovibrio intestinalis]MBB5142967.1 hypothetical protein [Desulfovibrio intestinalis]